MTLMVRRLIPILLAASVSAAAAETPAESVVEPAPGRRVELIHLLKQDCGSCHGMTLKGGLGLSLLPGDLRHKPVSFLARVILEGRPGTAMPPWKRFLSENEARWMAALLKKGLKE